MIQEQIHFLPANNSCKNNDSTLIRDKNTGPAATDTNNKKRQPNKDQFEPKLKLITTQKQKKKTN